MHSNRVKWWFISYNHCVRLFHNLRVLGINACLQVNACCASGMSCRGGKHVVIANVKSTELS